MPAIEVIDATGIVRLCIKQDCDTELVSLEIQIHERSVPAIASAVARTLAELTSPARLGPLAQAILDNLNAHTENPD